MSHLQFDTLFSHAAVCAFEKTKQTNQNKYHKTPKQPPQKKPNPKPSNFSPLPPKNSNFLKDILVVDKMKQDYEEKKHNKNLVLLLGYP